MNNKLSENQIKLLIAVVFIIVFAGFILSGGREWLNIDNLLKNRDALSAYTEQHFVMVMLASALIYIISTTFSLPGGTVLSLAVGFLFGRWTGTLIIVLSATVGATCVFLLARYLVADWAREKLSQSEQASKIMTGFESDAFNYMLFLRLVPLFPFWLVNLAPAFTPIPIQTYIISTLIGIIPGSFVFANLGQSLGSINSLDQLVSGQTLFAFILLGMLSITPVLYKRYKVTQKNNDE